MVKMFFKPTFLFASLLSGRISYNVIFQGILRDIVCFELIPSAGVGENVICPQGAKALTRTVIWKLDWHKPIKPGDGY